MTITPRATLLKDKELHDKSRRDRINAFDDQNKGLINKIQDNIECELQIGFVHSDALWIELIFTFDNTYDSEGTVEMCRGMHKTKPLPSQFDPKVSIAKILETIENSTPAPRHNPTMLIIETKIQNGIAWPTLLSTVIAENLAYAGYNCTLEHYEHEYERHNFNTKKAVSRLRIHNPMKDANYPV